MLYHLSVLHSFILWRQYSIDWMNHVVFIHSLVYEHVGCLLISIVYEQYFCEH